jgi:uncharacterized protein
VKLSWDEAKRQATLDERGLEFAWAAELFNGKELTSEDVRFDYGERRFICFGSCANGYALSSGRPDTKSGT